MDTKQRRYGSERARARRSLYVILEQDFRSRNLELTVVDRPRWLW